MNEASLTIAASFAVGVAAFAAFVVLLLRLDARTPGCEPLVPAAAQPTPHLRLAPPPRAPIPSPAIGHLRYAVIVVAFLVWSLAVSDHLVRH
jgi:hypothetical protein